MTQDVIDQLVGEPLTLRNRRPITKAQTQASYEALFESKDPGSFSKLERFAVALFVAALHRDTQAHSFYAEKLRMLSPSHGEIIDQTAAVALSQGPYGIYPDGPLSRENSEGTNWQADETLVDEIGRKLGSALEHAHFLVFHPRDASKSRLEHLIEAGWDTPSIVTLSQLVGFLTYQLRIAQGLRALAANPVN